jgi:excisionase family DNA binding protein
MRAASDHLLTVDQLGEQLQVPVTTIYGWRYKGTGPKAIVIGRHLRFRQSDVDAWLESRADQPRTLGR